MKYTSKKNLLWVFAVSTLVLILGSIPTWAGYKNETSELRFRGLYFDSQDYAVHISMMEAGKHGDTAYTLRFTTEPNQPVYLRLFYIILGHVSRIFNLSTETTFHLARWLLGYLALFSVYKLFELVINYDPFWTRTGFLLAVLGSGLGWLQLIFNWSSGAITPIDFWLIDCYVFFSLSLFPHFAFVTIGMCTILYFWMEYLNTHQWQFILWISITGILVQVANPIALATIDTALLGATLADSWMRQKIRRTDYWTLGIIAISQIPYLFYSFATLNNNPIWSQFTAQNKTLSPPLDYYLWGFALFLPFAILGVIKLFCIKSRMSAAALFWILSGFMLAYSPFAIQRRFLQNITIPLAILAAQGLIWLFETAPAQRAWATRWKSSIIIIFVFFTSVSSIQLSLGRALYTQSHPADLYYPANLENAIGWLRENAQYNDFILASEETSQVLAQKAGMRVYSGHEMETLYYDQKRELVKSYFSGVMNDLAESPIRWVIYGPYEQEINKDFQPAANLQLVYDENSIKIYKIK